MADYFDLGTYQREVTTTSEQARLWFTRGLLWTYGFNHEEAVSCFERAIGGRPGSARWPTGDWPTRWARTTTSRGRPSTRRTCPRPWPGPTPRRGPPPRPRPWPRCRRPSGRSSQALASRYPSAEPAGDCAAWNRGYADAMRAAYREHPGDLDVAVLFADALMNLTPWAAVGHQDRRASRRRRHHRGAGRARARRWPPPAAAAHPGAAAPVHPPDGDVAAARGRAVGRRPAARPGPGRRAPACTCRRTWTCCAATTGRWSSCNRAAIKADERVPAASVAR